MNSFSINGDISVTMCKMQCVGPLLMWVCRAAEESSCLARQRPSSGQAQIWVLGLCGKRAELNTQSSARLDSFMQIIWPVLELMFLSSSRKHISVWVHLCGGSKVVFYRGNSSNILVSEMIRWEIWCWILDCSLTAQVWTLSFCQEFDKSCLTNG